MRDDPVRLKAINYFSSDKLPPSGTFPKRLAAAVARLRVVAAVKLGHTPSINNEQQRKTSAQRCRRMSKDEANKKAMALAKADPLFLEKTLREWALTIGCSGWVWSQNCLCGLK